MIIWVCKPHSNSAQRLYWLPAWTWSWSPSLGLFVRSAPSVRWFELQQLAPGRSQVCRSPLSNSNSTIKSRALGNAWTFSLVSGESQKREGSPQVFRDLSRGWEILEWPLAPTNSKMVKNVCWASKIKSPSFDVLRSRRGTFHEMRNGTLELCWIAVNHCMYQHVTCECNHTTIFWYDAYRFQNNSVQGYKCPTIIIWL